MTTKRRINFPKVDTQVVSFAGGVNETVSSLELGPGELIVCKNYIIDETTVGGYSSIPGYERYNGDTKPSSVLLGVDNDDTARELARTEITEVPGEGNVLGVCTFKGITYAFRNKVGGLTAGMYKATAAGWVEILPGANVLLPGGRYTFDSAYYALYGDVLFWANGVDHAKQFNGTTIVDVVNTGMGANDKPLYLVATWDALILGYLIGSVQKSNVSDPLDWAAGVEEWNLGYELTSLTQMLSDTIVATGRKDIKFIKRPEDQAGFFLVNFSSTIGAIPYTVQKLYDTLIFASDHGITTLQATQDFGDFGTASVSEKIKRTFTAEKGNITGSVVLKTKNQYRLYFGTKFIVLTFYNKKLKGITKCIYDTAVKTIQEGRDSSNNPIIFFTSTNGYVYQLDSGTSFDGAVISTKIATAYYHYKSPRHVKQFLQFTTEIASEDELEIMFIPAYDYSAVGVPKSIEDIFIAPGMTSSIYGTDLWGFMKWSGSGSTNRLFIRTSGIGSNANISLYTSSKIARQHTLQNFITDFIVIRRQI